MGNPLAFGQVTLAAAQVLFGLFLFGHVDDRSHELQIAGAVEHRTSQAVEVPDRSVGPDDAVAHLEIAPVADRVLVGPLNRGQIVGMNEPPCILDGELEGLGIETEDAVQLQ